MLVGFGQVSHFNPRIFFIITSYQVVCVPVGPRCDLCELSTKGLCPSAQKTSKSKTRKAVVLAPEASTSTSESLSKVGIEIETEEEKTDLYTTPDEPLPGVKNEEAW